MDSAEQVSSVGAIDVLTLHEVAGWAWDPRNPDESVIVEILDGDRVVLEVLADRPRADLAAIGLGNGRHGFAVKPLDDFLPMSRHLVRVRRKLDGADLPGNPGWLIRDRGAFDPAAIDFLEAAVERSLAEVQSPDDLGPPTAILLSLLNRVINRQMSMAVDKDSHARSVADQAYQSGASDWMLDLLGRLQSDYPPLHFDVSETSPEVSVIIPVFNKFSYTYNCIKSIYDNPPECSFEIILVDDFSTDETMLCSLVLSGAVKIVRNEKNLNFVRTCNRGAAAARGRFLFFLNNDTLVKPGWLDELVRTFSAIPNVGIAGSKLLFENGSLQETGGIIWRMGDGWNWGRGRDPQEPAFCYLRDVDWVSGAALMIPKALFDELGGFDEHYVPAYYEDTDLAFRARAAGKRTVVQPASEIVHLEGVSNGKDVTGTGTKRFQAINHRKFFTRWKEVLLSHRLNGEQPELEAERTVKLRAYFIDETVPTPDRDAGSNAALQHMIGLMELGYKVTFLPSDNMAKISPYTEKLQKLGIECLYHPFYWSVEEVFRKAKVQPDLVYLHRYANATKYATMVRRYFPKCRILYSVADIHFLRIERQAELENSDELRRYAAEIRTAELAAMRQVDSVIVHSTYEADLLKQIEGNLRVTVVPWTISANPTATPFAKRSGFAFFGGYGHPPNIDAAKYLVEEVGPRLWCKRDETLYLAGSQVPPEITQLRSSRVNVVGHVPVLADLLHRVKCTVVPLRYGAGIKGKVLESLAHGLPCVMSEIAAEGIELPPALRWLVARSLDEYAEKLENLLEDESLNTELANLGVDFIKTKFSRDMIVDGLRSATAVGT